MTDTRRCTRGPARPRPGRPASGTGNRRESPIGAVDDQRLDRAAHCWPTHASRAGRRTSIPTPTRWAARWRSAWAWRAAATTVAVSFADPDQRARVPARPARPASGRRRRRGAGATRPAGHRRRRLGRAAGLAAPGCWTPRCRASSSTTTPSNTAVRPAITCRRRPPRRRWCSSRRMLDRLGIPIDRGWPRTSTPAWPPTPATSGMPLPHAHRLAAGLIDAGVRPSDCCCRSPTPTRSAGSACCPRCSARRCWIRPRPAGAGWCYTRHRRRTPDGLRPEELDSVIDILRTAQEARVAAVLKQTHGRQLAGLAARSGRPINVSAAAARPRRRRAPGPPASPTTATRTPAVVAPSTLCWTR